LFFNNPAAFKIKNDPRINPTGRILRKTSIYELLQLFKGDMSLVGPRRFRYETMKSLTGTGTATASGSLYGRGLPASGRSA
jgi:lipopolysaccharide/colanic/teichoic acid biosynthesis glycosyltransferase